MTLIAYHGRPSDKDAILAELAAHRAADQLVQGYGYWKDGKGCAVGCTIQSGDHVEYERRFGIPIAVARLEDSIFEGLPVDLARQWPERLMGAIRPGQDLSRVHWHLLHWLLTDESVNPGINHPLVADAVRQCADLMAGLAAGKSAESAASAASAAWSAESAASAARAESAARSAAWSAESAAWSAASAASAAWSADSAARSAASAAWSAARSAASAARSADSAESAARIKISDKLIAIIAAAPMASEQQQ